MEKKNKSHSDAFFQSKNKENKDNRENDMDNMEEQEQDNDNSNLTSNFIRNLEINSFADLESNFKSIHKGIIKLRSIVLINNFKTKDEVITSFKNFFTVKTNENFYKINDNNLMKTSFEGYFWFLPNSTSLILATFNTQKEIDHILFKEFLKKSINFAPLWINQKMIKSLMEHLEFNYDFVMTNFSSEYNKIFRTKSQIRPFIDRKINYFGNDALQAYNELKDQYGLIINAFKGLIENVGFFSLNREKSTFIMREGDFNKLIEIIMWTYEQSDIYIKEIRLFQTKNSKSYFNPKKYKPVSNDLSIYFKSHLSQDILDNLVEKIEDHHDLKIIFNLSKHISSRINYLDNKNMEDPIIKSKENTHSINKEIDYSTDKERIHDIDIKLINKVHKGSFRLYVNKNEAHIFQIFGANYLGIFPLLDTLDRCQPTNTISVR